MQLYLILLLKSKHFLVPRTKSLHLFPLQSKLEALDMAFVTENPTRQRVLLSGGSGMLGSAIAKALHSNGVSILRMVRRPSYADHEMQWNPSTGEIEDPGKLEGLTAAIHLSGANVASRRWSPSFKREMTQSRVQTTQFLSNALAGLNHPPSVLVAASAVGFYGDRGEEILDEDSPPGRGYFPDLCVAWESATHAAEQAGIRVVHLRFGMVIGPDGGALARLAPLFRLGLGGRLGNGRQWMSWVSEADAVAAALLALQNPQLSGPLNTVAPNPVTNTDFTQTLGHAVHRPAILPAPAFALRLAFGEMADEALLASTRAIPRRLAQSGFVFQHPTLAEAFHAALPSESK
jgi:uncharacterized protein (TIGR01777 family)